MSLPPNNPIHQLVSKILVEEVPVKLLELTRQLFDALEALVLPVVSLDPDQKDSILQSGKALSPYAAAVSIKEFKRTQQFMRGVLQAIDDLKANHPHECINVLYAGTGPFAVLVLPVLYKYDSSQVKFTFLDIHQEAIESLTYLLEILGLNDFIENMVCMDVTEYHLPNDRKTHLILTETMQRALVNETQTAITFHLAPQADPDTIWIPESIHIDAVLVNRSMDMDRMMGRLVDGESSFYQLGQLIDLNMPHARDVILSNGLKSGYLDEVAIDIPTKQAHEYPMLTLMTTIFIYGDHLLLPNESSITLPLELQDLRELESMPTSVNIAYRIGNHPGYESRFTY